MTWYITGNNIDPTKNNFLGTINDQPLVIKTNNTERMRIDPDGNVGIGKVSASGTPYRLDVAGAINATDILKGGVPLGGGEASQWGEVAGGINYAGGNVGIGTTGPLYRLHVVAPGGFGGEDANGVSLTGNVPLIAQSDSTAIGVINASGRQAFALNIDGNGGTTNARGVPTLYDKYDGAWHQCLSLKNGNVGIGTYDPTHRFHVRAAEAVGLFESTGGQAYLRLSTSEGLDNRVEITNRPGGRLSLWTAGAGDIFNITRGGNVGIGTTSPATRLSVAGGGATINGVALGTDVPGIDYPYEYETVGVANTNMNLRLQSPNAIVFHTGDTPAQRMLVAENGDVTMTGRLGTGNWPAQPRTSGWGGGIRTWDVEAEGTIWSSHGYTQGSDARMKSDVEQLSNVLDKLESFRGVSFEWIDGGTAAGNQRNIGVIAQEVEKVFPELVSQHGEEGQKAVDYSGLAGILIEATKELKSENEALRAKLDAGGTALRSAMDELRARIKALEPVR